MPNRPIQLASLRAAARPLANAVEPWFEFRELRFQPAHADGAELDLLIDSPGALPIAAIGGLREAFAESNLPFSVDLLERGDASAEFLARIANDGLVDLKLPPVDGRAPFRRSLPAVGADPCA